MHTKHADLARTATCWQDTPEDEAFEAPSDGLIASCAFFGMFLVLLGCAVL